MYAYVYLYMHMYICTCTCICICVYAYVHVYDRGAHMAGVHEERDLCVKIPLDGGRSCPVFFLNGQSCPAFPFRRTPHRSTVGS